VRPLSLAFVLVLGLSIAGGAAAKATQCKDDKGKFIKCPPAAAAPAATTRCKDAKGKFIKCGTPPAAASSAPAAPAASSATPTAGGGPAGATAKCKDGTFSSSKTHSGACSHHGGVASWLH
jgi:hypothetical protein